jgi:hypothetical protein
MNVYTFELIPNITITFSKLILTFDPNMPQNISKSSIWALYYLHSISASDDTPDITFIYNDSIKYPIAIPLAIPNTSNWETNSTNGIFTYMNNIFNTNNTFLNNISIIDPTNPKNPVSVDGLTLITNNLSNFIKKLGNTQISSITDIFVLYDPIEYKFQSCIYTNLIDSTTNKNIICPLILFSTNYIPIYCPTGKYYNGKCIPGCPPSFSYDFGLVCLNNNINNYLPNSDLCNYINNNINNNFLLSSSPSSSVNPIFEGILEGCDPDYFNKTKSINQSDIINTQESFGNVNITKNNNIFYFSPYL